ncbi:hypothetical protein M413DRAFT_12247 [Hebeloma cylindrosporum]|uniref:Uncharacterized protein n=1 Tax=Hebeloma cylindrosporum TaxID=76867 RepID=A0A0C2YE23_HEBCY|nr:hypothetical protein M413DRAFT_12247 [Hebeloma cylindrosporum h7]
MYSNLWIPPQRIPYGKSISSDEESVRRAYASSSQSPQFGGPFAHFGTAFPNPNIANPINPWQDSRTQAVARFPAPPVRPSGSMAPLDGMGVFTESQREIRESSINFDTVPFIIETGSQGSQDISRYFPDSANYHSPTHGSTSTAQDYASPKDKRSKKGKSRDYGN